MKHLLVIAMAFISINTFAQVEQTENKTLKRERFTPEQIAELQTKRMALNLDLNESQTQKIYTLNLAKAKERHAKRKTVRSERKKHTSEDRFKRKNERLDKALARKKEMKTILTNKQFEKWETQTKKRSRRSITDKRNNLKGKKEKRPNRTRRHFVKEN